MVFRSDSFDTTIEPLLMAVSTKLCDWTWLDIAPGIIYELQLESRKDPLIGSISPPSKYASYW